MQWKRCQGDASHGADPGLSHPGQTFLSRLWILEPILHTVSLFTWGYNLRQATTFQFSLLKKEGAGLMDQ